MRWILAVLLLGCVGCSGMFKLMGLSATPSRLETGSGDFGTAHPTVIRAYDEGERWMALCQAREDTNEDGEIAFHVNQHGGLYGDKMILYLVIGGGEGTAIESLVSQSADGRWLAILRDGALELVDSRDGTFFTMNGADTASDQRPGERHRAADFAGKRVLFFRHRPEGDALVVHDLESHAEREIPMKDRLWRIAEAGPLTKVLTIPQGPSFPKLATTLSQGECRGDAMSFSMFGQRGPEPTEHWINLDGGREVNADGVVAAIESTLVRAPNDGSLYLDSDQVAPPACNPQILALLASPSRVMAICGEKHEAKVLWLGKGIRVELASIDRESEHYAGYHGALAPAAEVICDRGRHCVASATNQPIDLQGWVAEYAFGHKLYVVHATSSSREHAILDIATGALAPIASGRAVVASGRLIIDRNERLVDIEAGADLGSVAGAWGLSASGRILRGGDESTGPLRWTKP